MEPVARQFAPLVDFVFLGLQRGWERAQPQFEIAWKELEPTARALTQQVDTVFESWRAWQVALFSCLGTLVLVQFLRSLSSFLREVNDLGIASYALQLLKRLPVVRSLVRRELEKVAAELWESVSKDGIPEDDPPLTEIPPEGLSSERLDGWLELKAAKSSSCARPGSSRLSGAVYFCDLPEHNRVVDKAYRVFSASNPLHSDIFPSVRRMEAEVVSMTASILGGGSGGNPHVCGLMTSGGTESILSAVKASRDFMLEAKGIRNPEMVVATSAHPAYIKAASYFGIRLVRVPVDSRTLRLTASAVQAAINGNTALVVASAPSYPHGVVDEVAGIAEAAMRGRVLCHVDACLGGFVLPFAKKLGYEVPPFDFSVPGVTSMSVDTHKYGLAHKGTSVVLFAVPRLRSKLYTAITEWSGGPYISPGIPGSRSGALIATAWASMASMGMNGFLEVTKGIMETSARFREGLGKIPCVQMLGAPEMSVIAFRSADPKLNIYQLNDKLLERGWHLAAMHLPPALHMCFTASHGPDAADLLLADIRECAEALLASGEAPKGGSAKLYGMSSSLPDRKLVGDVLTIYQDIQLAIY